MTAQPASRVDPAPSPPRSRLPRALVTAAAIVLLLAAIALLGASFASYATVKHRLDAFASDHDANLSRERFGTVVWQLRLAAVACVAAAAALRLRRTRLEAALEALFRAAAADRRAATAALRRALAAESRLHLASLAAIVVGAVLVRLDFLFQPMRYDEADTYVHYASRPLYIGLTAYTAPNNHVFHTLLVHITTAIFGGAPWAIRLPALVAGVLLVPAAYLAARLLYGATAAIVTAALVATSSTLVEYSTNARGYTLLALLFLLLVALGTRLRDSASPSAWAAFALLVALGLWTIPIMVYGVATMTLWLTWTILLERRRTELLRTRLLPALAGGLLLALVLYAPVLVTAGPHALFGNSFVTPRSWSYLGHELPRSLAATFSRWHRDQPLVLWAVLAAGFVTAVVFHRRVGRVPVPPVAAAALAVPPLVVAQRVVPFERVWLFLLPLYAMTAAAGVLFLLGRLGAHDRFAAAVALAAVALCAGLAGEAAASRAVAHSEDTSTFRDAPAVAAYLRATLRPGDRVLVSPPADQILEYYLLRDRLDAGRLLYTDFRARRLLAVVKEGPHGYPLPVVIRQHLPPREAQRARATVLRRFPHAVVYRVRG